MVEREIDGRSVPLMELMHRLHDETFAGTRRKTVDVVLRLLWSRSGTVPVMRSPGILQRQLRGIRSRRQLEHHLSHDLNVKDLMSCYWWSLHFLVRMGRAPVDSPEYQEGRKLLGRRPTHVSMLRAAVRFWMRREPPLP